jgi:hypothetical protein
MTNIQHYKAPTLALSQVRTKALDARVHSLVLSLATGNTTLPLPNIYFRMFLGQTMLALLDRQANWCSLTASQHLEDRLPRRSMSKRNMRTRGSEAGREVYGGDSWCNGIE